MSSEAHILVKNARKIDIRGMNKTLISLFIAFLIGFGSSRIFSGRLDVDKEKDAANAKCEDLTEAKSSLLSISKKDYLEYLQIKDLKQKYEKADELLGKIMLLFLADVGFRAQKSTPIEVVEAAPQTPAIAASSEVTPSAPVEKKSTNLNDKGAVIRSMGSEKRIIDALENVIIENPKLEAAQGNVPNRQQVKLLEGRYVGTVSFLDSKRGSLSVVWDLAPDYSKKGLSGTFNLSIHGPGTNSESSGRGDIDSVVSLAQDPNGFIVNGCGGSCYMQLYYNNRSEQFYGNYYEVPKDTQSKAQRVGIVKLGR